MLIAENYNEVLIAPPHLDAASRLDFRRAALEHLAATKSLDATATAAIAGGNAQKLLGM